jgi:hypothetical protein
MPGLTAILLKLLGVGGAAAAFGGIIYLATGAGSEKNSQLVPDEIENEIDNLVNTLNRRYSRGWILMAEAALMAAVPVPLHSLLMVVRITELRGEQNDWSGEQKREHAADLYRQGAS